MKTLLIKYTPRNERSNTKKLLDAFREEIKGSEIEELDLTQDVPELFLVENLAAYIQRNYLGQELASDQKRILSKMDRMTAQLKSADIVTIAYPMNNFSMPAPVKAWFDSVMLKGQTWDVKDGSYVGMMHGKKALTIVSSGGSYETGPHVPTMPWVSLAKIEFQFMGYSDVEGVLAQGMNAGDATKSVNLQKSIDKVKAIAHKWYTMYSKFLV